MLIGLFAVTHIELGGLTGSPRRLPVLLRPYVFKKNFKFPQIFVTWEITIKYLSISLPIPFFKHPSCLRRGLKYKTLFSLSRISYFFNMCYMSQPQFLLFPPKSDRSLHYDPVQDSVQFYYVSYFFNMCYVPTPV